MLAVQKDISAGVRCREGAWEKGTDQVLISWCMAQDRVPLCWAPPCSSFLLGCPVSSMHGLTGKQQQNSRADFCSCAQWTREESPVVRISQPCFPVKLSLITTALFFLPVPVSQIVPAWLFPASAQCCQLVSAQPGLSSSKHVASK